MEPNVGRIVRCDGNEDLCSPMWRSKPVQVLHKQGEDPLIENNAFQLHLKKAYPQSAMKLSWALPEVEMENAPATPLLQPNNLRQPKSEIDRNGNLLNSS